ncbi:MAG: hypothetical protein KA120_08130 [Candidatus Goldbacteria bacterium]|nr:hypothetical protein [Candidatus Goldiibacteriota bacterium]
MKLQVVEIGNSKGVRIPKAILEQVKFDKEVELDVSEGKIVLKRIYDPNRVFGFETIAEMDDGTLHQVLGRVNTADLIIALMDAGKEIKEAVYRNLSEQKRNYVKSKVTRLEKGNAKDILIEYSRNVISDAFVELLRQ